MLLFTVLALGFFGGQLAYSGKVPVGPAEFRSGEKLFRANCSGCHPYGGNIVDPKAELRGSDELKDLQTFIRWIRDPRLDNGAKGPMPPFLPARVSDAQAKELLGYIIKVMGPAEAGPCVRCHHSHDCDEDRAGKRRRKGSSSLRQTAWAATICLAPRRSWGPG